MTDTLKAELAQALERESYSDPEEGHRVVLTVDALDAIWPIVEELGREHLERGRTLEKVWLANESVAVCAKHVAEVTGDGCLVCAAMQAEAERKPRRRRSDGTVQR